MSYNLLRGNGLLLRDRKNRSGLNSGSRKAFLCARLSVFVDMQDEFIDYDGLQLLLREKNLDKWRLVPVHKDKDVADTMPHHIIIDQQSVGAHAWETLVTTIKAHLRP